MTLSQEQIENVKEDLKQLPIFEELDKKNQVIKFSMEQRLEVKMKVLEDFIINRISSELQEAVREIRSGVVDICNKSDDLLVQGALVNVLALPCLQVDNTNK